ncbi:MAG: hypothetical protein V5A24_06995, partial [Haloarculaceae archaeon]
MLAFEQLTERPGLEVVDRLERTRYRLHTPEPVRPDPAATDRFRFPVGAAVEVETAELVLPNVVGVTVRGPAGDVVAELGHLDEEHLPEGEYVVELFTQIKTYVEVESEMTIDVDLTEIQFDFGGSTAARIGARSRHERPAATVTTTADPTDLMAAIGTFGSALKSLSPERSYPTLRGHPPDVEVGDELSIPDEIERPDSGVSIEVPATCEHVFAVAPLSYYLGASIEPGEGPRLLTDRGFEYEFGVGRDYETDIAETLKRVFFLDCLTRTEGLYDYDLHERRALEPRLDLDFETLYDRSLQEQLAAYLSVPYKVIEDYVPEWRLTAHVEPDPTAAELLPFVVDDLAVIRSSQRSTDRSNAGATMEPDLGREEVLTRSAGPADITSAPTGPGGVSTGSAGHGGVITRSPGSTGVGTRSKGDSMQEPGSTYVQPVADGTLEQAWIGDRIPVGASKLTEAAFRNRFDRDLTDGNIRISIVVNDSRMAEERDLVNSAYGDRENLPFDVTVHHEKTVEELREVLASRSEFFHYIGHTEYDGFECADGKLDVARLEETGVDSFLLNACNSYNQGLNLIEAGAIGGIVTLNDIINDGAVRIGESVARLLNAGFPLRASLSIARKESVQGGQYIVVGDGGMTVTQAASRTPNSLRVSRSGGEFDLSMKTYAT